MKFYFYIAGLVCYIFYLFTFFTARHKNDFGTGQFGDAFGAANALFTGFAFVGLMYAVYLQRTELSVMREERDDTRELLDEQRKLNVAHERTLIKQSFDQNFMGVVSMIIELRQSLSFISSTNTTSISRAATSSRSKLNNVSLLWGKWDCHMDAFQKECQPIIRLASVAENMVRLSDVINATEKAEYLKRVASLFDQNLSTIFAFYAAIYADEYPEYLYAYSSLEINENIDLKVAGQMQGFLTPKEENE